MASARSLQGVMKFLSRDTWRTALNETLDLHLASACAKADVAFEDLADIIGDRNFSVIWGCVFEDLLARDLDDGRNLMDDYLKRRGWKESASNRAYMAALRSSAMSLYEVSDIIKGESFLARDLVRGGEPVRVSERSGTHYLKPWDRLAGRLVQLGSRIEMAGGALPFDLDASEAVLKTLREAVKEAGAGENEVLRASAFVFTNIWLDDLLQRTLNPHLPQMCNTDGEEIAFTTVSYPLKPDANIEAIRHALDAIPSLRAESETFWNWTETRAPVKERARSQMIYTTLDDGSIGLGTIELKEETLVLEANSPQRAERGRDMIRPVLEGLVGEPIVESQAFAELVASSPNGKSEKPPTGLLPDEERALVHAYLDQYYANLLDEPVPMLGNITPRGAARSKKGRDKLVAWLKGLENSTARAGSGSAMSGYDATWIWEELGVSNLRR